MSKLMNKMKKEAEAFGCHNLVCLGEGTSHELEYLDLLDEQTETTLNVDAIAEYQSRPLIYIVYGTQARSSKGDIVELQHLLANRGERAYLGFLSPGELEIRPINLDREKIKNIAPFIINSQDGDAPVFFQSVANGAFSMDGLPESPDYIFDTILQLMTKSSDELINECKLPPLDVLSCMGRALFFRFLRDRKIILEKELKTLVNNQIKTWEDCFANAKNSLAVCNWLDDTFNGDLLPFSQGNNSFFSHANKLKGHGLFMHMQAILLGWEYVGSGIFQPTLDWNDLDFAHIPIGVLSQVYEQFSRIWDEQQAKETSVFYTPKTIAKYLVEDAFASLTDKKNAKILDPSCGAGIFLVLAFRALVRSYWEKEKKRPNTRAIQDILYKQIRGFDISESALRLAALSLYITAIELNNSPRPPKSLKFPRPLQGEVLFNQRTPEDDNTTSFVLGSLRSDLPDNFDKSFDLVIGNPPWSRLKVDKKGLTEEEIEKIKKKIKEISNYFTTSTKKILENRGLKEQAQGYSNPDNNPDLPFLWKATEWAKPGGLIAMALPSRIFLKQTPIGQQAFQTILHGIEVTGILNGSNLSDTPVWPGMNQPFMLFFAKNHVPAKTYSFHFVSPQFEKRLNKKGLLRIDYSAALPIPIENVISMPWLLKSLAIGTILDSEILRKMFASSKKTLKELWQPEDGLYGGEGYNISDGLKQNPSLFMKGLPDFQKPESNAYQVSISSLPPFERGTLHGPRKKVLYLPPLLIIPQALGNSMFSPKSYILRSSVVFKKSYYGYSANQHPEKDLLISFLHLLTHSKLFRYYALMTSSKFGTERRTIHKSELDTIPIPDLKTLKKKKEICLSLSKRLETEKDKPWMLINNFISEAYGLEEYDFQVIEDSLNVGSPFQDSRSKACAYPSPKKQKNFYKYLYELLAPSFVITGEDVKINPIDFGSKQPSPWIFFSISSSTHYDLFSAKDEKYLINQALEEADNTGCSRVFIPYEGKLLVGLLAQYRYWTLSRAHLCGLHILRKYLDNFPIKGEL